MNAPSLPEDPQPPVSTVLVPMPYWEQALKTVPDDSPLKAEMVRLHEESQTFETPAGESVAYQIMAVLAKSDGNVTTHMAERTMAVMYGEMVRNPLATFTITRKDQETR